MSSRPAHGQPRAISGIADAAVPASTAILDSAGATARVARFDFVKGALVVIMVIYHWFNYYVGLQWGGYRYLRFLTPSYIFITGFLVSRVYLKRYVYDDPRLRRRLVSRGLKLLLLFIGLNVVVEQTIGGRLGLNLRDSSTIVSAAEAVFVTASGRAVFDVLVSIAYFLLLAPVVLFVSRRLHLSLAVLAAIAVVSVATSGLLGWGNPHLEMFAIGCVGLAAGVQDDSRFVAALRAPAVLLSMYLIYVAVITWWNTPFLIQVIGVCLSLLLIDAIAMAAGEHGVIQRGLIRMGEYSLLAYISQIVVLQLLRRVLWGVPLLGAGSVIPLVLTLAMTLIVVDLTIALRAKSGFVDRAYRAVFA